MSNEECRRFEKKLAFHTAPSLLGIKCASLFTLSGSEFDIGGNARRFNCRAAARGLRIKVLRSECSCANRSLILVYSPRLLSERISAPENRELLREYGYTDVMSLDESLDLLSSRMSNGDFPHEIGVFLGYPAEDVRGFVENGGCNYKLCGCWKVYGSVESARRKFAAYDRCREYLCGKLEQGEDLYQALKIS